MVDFAVLNAVANTKPMAGDRLMLVEPEYQAIAPLPASQVGAIVEMYPGGSPRYLVEFAELDGREYAMAILQLDELLALRYQKGRA